MADFVAVLKKTIEGLPDNTPELRQKVYGKARDTVTAKLAAITPPPSQIAVDRQLKALEEAIGAVERGFAGDDKADDFDSVLADLETRAKPGKAEIPAAPSAAVGAAATPPAESDAVGPTVADDNTTTADANATPARASRLSTPPELEGATEGDELVAVAPASKPIPRLPRASSIGPEAESAGNEAGKAARPARRGVSGMLIAAAVALVVVAGAGYGVWLNRDAFADMFGMGGNIVAGDPVAEEPAPDVAAEAPATETAAPEPQEEVEIAALPPEPEAAPAESAPASSPAVDKFTQRLNPDGTEIDEGPAGGERSIGEGTTLAAVTAPGTAAGAETATDAGSGNGAASASLPVGQKAIFYEERTTLADGTADDGATVWTLVQESPGGDQPPEPAIRGEVSIPSRDLQLRMTIRRNADVSLPASHIVEMIFITSGTFEGGGVENVLRIAFKGSEADAGSPLIGIPAKIADGYFLVALSDNEAERNQNTQLMLQQNWIDVPISYRSGRRALVTMEKGIPGNKVFQDAIRAWQAASSG